MNVSEAAREMVERTRRAQGLPLHVEDPATLRRIATILRSADDAQRETEKARRAGVAEHFRIGDAGAHDATRVEPGRNGGT